jgi:hypothetical protein
VSRKALALLCEAFSIKAVSPRNDGKWDAAISHSLKDQLQTASLPKENLSDTVERILSKKGTN